MKQEERLRLAFLPYYHLEAAVEGWLPDQETSSVQFKLADSLPDCGRRGLAVGVCPLYFEEFRDQYRE